MLPLRSRLRFSLLVMCLAGVLIAAPLCAPFADPDLNDDGTVNILDVSLVSSCLGLDPTSLPQCRDADPNGDGVVDQTDLDYVSENFGASGFEVDVDRDGFTPTEGDCDDSDPASFPGAIDVPDNGIDEDCDGADAGCVEVTTDTYREVLERDPEIQQILDLAELLGSSSSLDQAVVCEEQTDEFGVATLPDSEEGGFLVTSTGSPTFPTALVRLLPESVQVIYRSFVAEADFSSGDEPTLEFLSLDEFLSSSMGSGSGTTEAMSQCDLATRLRRCEQEDSVCAAIINDCRPLPGQTKLTLLKLLSCARSLKRCTDQFQACASKGTLGGAQGLACVDVGVASCRTGNCAGSAEEQSCRPADPANRTCDPRADPPPLVPPSDPSMLCEGKICDEDGAAGLCRSGVCESLCGNGIVDSAVGEQCDPEIPEQQLCCSSTCAAELGETCAPRAKCNERAECVPIPCSPIGAIGAEAFCPDASQATGLGFRECTEFQCFEPGLPADIGAMFPQYQGCMPVDAREGTACSNGACGSPEDPALRGVCLPPEGPECTSADCPDDGMVCNGEEFCDPLNGCDQRNAPPAETPCEGGGLCDAGQVCVAPLCVPEDCPDDGLVCNGEEFCDPLVGCGRRNAPPEGTPCEGGGNCNQNRECVVSGCKYSYVGPAFEFFRDETPPEGAFTTSQRVTASFTVDERLAPGLAGLQMKDEIVSFYMDAGRFSLTQGLYDATFWTNDSGDIINWAFEASTTGRPAETEVAESYIATWSFPQLGGPVQDRAEIECLDEPCAGDIAAVFHVGSWSRDCTPGAIALP